MKKHFFEFYPLSEKEIDSIWSGGIISFEQMYLSIYIGIRKRLEMISSKS